MKRLKIGCRVKMIRNGYAVPPGTEGELTGIKKNSQFGYNFLVRWDPVEGYRHANPFNKSKYTWADEGALEVL